MEKNGKIGAFEPDNLIFDNKFPLDVASVFLKKGQGVLKRGSLITLMPNRAGKLYDDDLDETADYVLSDDFDTGAVDDGLEDSFGTAYRSGHFNRRALITAGAENGYFTVSMKTEDSLRCKGIYLSNAAH